MTISSLRDELVVQSSPLLDASELLSYLPTKNVFAWINNGEGLVGWGEAARFEFGTGTQRFATAKTAFEQFAATVKVTDDVGVTGSGLVAFGSFTFAPDAVGSVLIVPKIVIGKRGDQTWITRIGNQNHPQPAAIPITPSSVRFNAGTLSTSQWANAVKEAVSAINAGKLAKVVLARDIVAKATTELDPRILLTRLAQRFPSCYTFACDGLIGATPELLIRKQDHNIESLLLAGTNARGNNAHWDNQLAQALLDSSKNRYEHELGLQSLQQALIPLCSSLHIPSEPSLLALANLRHIATHITGKLHSSAISALELVSAIHPTAAVGGTPTNKALAFIKQVEGMQRGRYAGPVGWIDAAGNGEWGIALRCAQLQGKQARLFAGCGIVADSDPATELAESEIKLDAMRNTLLALD